MINKGSTFALLAGQPAFHQLHEYLGGSRTASGTKENRAPGTRVGIGFLCPETGINHLVEEVLSRGTKVFHGSCWHFL